MLAALASNITISIGGNSWVISTSLIVYIIIAAIIGVIAEFIVGWRVPFGIVGAIIAGIIGIWLLTSVIKINGFSDIILYGVPLIRALIGAIIFIALWHAITGGFRPRRRRYAA